MTVLNMTPVELATLDMTPGAAGPVDFSGMDAHATSTMTLVPLVNARTQVPIQEPSSMTLALIGIVTLAAYRGIQKRVTRYVAPKATTPKLIKPRSIKERRAA
jgi:hypothetical protein